jgi:hypothetical protein
LILGRKRKMHKIGNKFRVAIAIILLASMVATVVSVSIPPASAHTPAWSIDTYCFVNVAPNPGAVGQAVYINCWLNWVPQTANNIYGDRWEFTVKITGDDGHFETFDLTSDVAGAAYTSWTPTKAGNYTIDVNFIEQTLEGKNPPPTGFTAAQAAYIGDTFKASNTSATFTIQEEPIPSYPNTPLPTDYWQRPINAQNTDWYKLGGSWLGLGAKLDFGGTGLYDNNGGFNPYSEGPKTAHILWTKPVAFGGQVGGPVGGTEDSVFYAGLQYEGKFSPIIISGVLYYVNLPSASNVQGWTALDLRTGQTLWTKNTTQTLRAGQLLQFITPNQYGSTAYLWATSGSTLIMCDAFTGNDILYIENATRGQSYFELFEDERGNLIGYYLNSTDRTLNMWNSTLNIMGDSNSWSWRPATGARYDFSRGIQWTVPLNTTDPTIPISPAGGLAGINILAASWEDQVIVATNAMTGTWQSSTSDTGYSMKDGSVLWGPINRTVAPWSSPMVGPAADGIYTVFTKELRQWTGYDIKTGEKAWGPTESYNDSYGYYNQRSATYAYGKLIAWSLGGNVYAYDMKTGEKQWQFTTGSSGTETVYGNWPLWIINNYEAAVADGIIYVEGGHTYNPPMFKGSQIYAINVTDGTLVYKSTGFFCGNPLAISDGQMVGLNSYDNQIYAYGKGQSGTTVSAPQTVTKFGDSIVITGTVTDQSPGQTCLGIPAAGTPAVADESMSAWMDYLYQQQPYPTDAKGVTVSLDVIDSNGNYRNIGTTTTDPLTGTYSFMWEPDIAGKYILIASFAGSQSYYSSLAQTAFGVEEAQPTPTSPEPVSQAPVELYFVASTIAIIIAIAVAVVLLLRKRP